MAGRKNENCYRRIVQGKSSWSKSKYLVFSAKETSIICKVLIIDQDFSEPIWTLFRDRKVKVDGKPFF